MNTETRTVLYDTDDQYKKFIALLKETDMELFIGEYNNFAPVSEEEVNTVWSCCNTKDVKANIAMDLVTSVLCAVSDEELPLIFKDTKKQFFKKIYNTKFIDCSFACYKICYGKNTVLHRRCWRFKKTQN